MGGYLFLGGKSIEWAKEGGRVDEEEVEKAEQDSQSRTGR